MSNMFHKHVFNKEGRMRLIDAEAKICESEEWKKLKAKEKMNITEFIISQPTIDAEPIRHGHWIIRKYAEEVEGFLISNYECTCCHTWRREKTKFCPDCGAKMNAEEH